jgi:uncharacterized membrane protein YphA (DoxX/SURF4 family)
MRINPFSDVLDFLTEGDWSTYVFLVLLIVSILLAAINLFRNPNQRSAMHVWNWLVRLIIGAMWWEQSLWKLPPAYSGLHYWVEEMGKWASIHLQQQFVRDVVLPHFFFFAPQVYFGEVFISVTLMLGLFSRLGGFLGALMAINLWLGLYRSPAEWPWTYFFLIIVQIMFVIQRPGRSLGLDAILVQRQKDAGSRGFWGRLFNLVS